MTGKLPDLTGAREKIDLASKLLTISRAASADLFFFARNVLGFDKMTTRTHLPTCRFLSSKHPYKLIILPRDTFKTTIATISYPLWKLISNPNLRIMLSSDTYDNSVKNLYKIKQIIETNEQLRLLFGDLKGDIWRSDEIYVKSRTSNDKEASISCASQDVTRVGQHFDIIILDDIVTDVNSMTQEQLLRSIDYFRSLFSILEPSGEMIVLGTRWAYNDLYGHIIDTMKRTFRTHIRAAIDKHGRLFFPERLTKEKLDELRELMGSSMFSAQYMNDPVPPEERSFKNYSFWQTVPPREELYVSVALDPAFSVEESADYAGLTVIGTDNRGIMYVLDAVNLKQDPKALIDSIFFFVDKWKADVFGIETRCLQKVLKFYIEAEETARKRILPMVEVNKGAAKSKYMRIIALQPFLERGQLLLNKNTEELNHQIAEYSLRYTKHDDLIDSLAMHLELYQKSQFARREETQKTREELTMEWIMRCRRTKFNDRLASIKLDGGGYY
jgi:predicted phage terminase large subunit-like protein